MQIIVFFLHSIIDKTIRLISERNIGPLEVRFAVTHYTLRVFFEGISPLNLENRQRILKHFSQVLAHFNSALKLGASSGSTRIMLTLG